ncbi:lytic transglycosylase domain-containing protein [Patescibacteria group bacterium]
MFTSLLVGSSYCLADDISLSFLGSLKKAERFYDELKEYSEKYKIFELDLLLSVAMVESGGNDDLISRAGARGLMQVMPRTYRAMKVKGYIEAGVKYLKQQIVEFYDYNSFRRAILAYHAGPSRVRRNSVPLTSESYYENVNLYRNIFMPENMNKIQKGIDNLEIIVLGKSQTWEKLAEKYNCSVIELRLYNSFLAYFDSDIVKKGRTFVYPKKSVEVIKDSFYTVRKGDLAPLLRNAFGIEIEKSIESGDKIWIEK